MRAAPQGGRHAVVCERQEAPPATGTAVYAPIHGNAFNHYERRTPPSMETPQELTEAETEPPDPEPAHAGPFFSMGHAPYLKVIPTLGENAFANRLHEPAAPRPDLPRPISNPRSQKFRRRFFPRATSNEWNDWRWQLQNRITALATLETMLDLSASERGAAAEHGPRLPFAVTPYYAAQLDRGDALDPLRRCVIPTTDELVAGPGDADDPLGEDATSPVPGLVHRYPDRVLFLVTGYCSVYCRFCTRSRGVGDRSALSADRDRWQMGIDYIARTPAVRDVLLSGGDPLTLPDEALDWLLDRLRRIPHVEVIRIGTKVPVVLPQRITPNLCRVLRRYHPLYISVHFTHPRELTPETGLACGRLANSGIPLGSQTVLLSGVNDSVETMKSLMQGLMRNRVRPYYLYQCDPITGSSHFRTPVARGLEIIRGLRGFTSGYAVPHYVIDAPGGGGKIPLLPNYVVGEENGDLVLRNYRDHVYRYPLAEKRVPLSAGAVE